MIAYSVKAIDVMTPRSVVFALAEDRKVSEVFEPIKDKPFSRIPIYKTGLDDITGFVLRDDILLSKASNQQGKMLNIIPQRNQTINSEILFQIT